MSFSFPLWRMRQAIIIECNVIFLLIKKVKICREFKWKVRSFSNQKLDFIRSSFWVDCWNKTNENQSTYNIYKWQCVWLWHFVIICKFVMSYINLACFAKIIANDNKIGRYFKYLKCSSLEWSGMPSPIQLFRDLKRYDCFLIAVVLFS